MKKKVIHFIYDMGRGGAETITVGECNELTEYENIVVTLVSMNHFGDELKCDKLICFDIKSLFALPLAFFKFRKLIRSEKPDLVHSHLFWPTIIARLSVPKKIPLVTTIHAFIATSVEYKNWHIRFLDKLTYRVRKSIIAADAGGAVKEYFSFLKLKPYKSYPLYSFVDTKRFNIANATPKIPSVTFRVISVGALRLQKNYSYLINAFALLKEEAIELHIYGNGNLQRELQQQIDESGAKVILKREDKNIHQIIPLYDLYVMSSSFEGFSVSVLEAMAMKMPLLLSDISSFREQADKIATFYSLSNVHDLKNKLLAFANKTTKELEGLGELGRQRAINNFTLEKHMEALRTIYQDALTDKTWSD